MNLRTHSDVAVLGLGLMGKALARALIQAGHTTTVWNRTTAKAGEVVAQGALLADNVSDAVGRNPVIIVCVTNYESLSDLLSEAAADLDGRVLVNLTSGDSTQAREMARWAGAQGAEYLDGAIMAIPPAIGTADALILLSGSRAAFDAHGPVLEALGTLTYLGGDQGLSAIYDVAGLSMMWGVLNAWLHGVALVETAGVDAATFTPFAEKMAQGTTGWLAGYAGQIDAGSFPSDDATLATHAGGIEHLVEESERLGVDAQLPLLFKRLVDRAIEAGHADRSYPSLIEQFRPGTATT